ncbi:hypothetical protein ATPR_0922 [Acetobacter tropicalis NBRC 101654]|uniref:Uncharacterized protein n=1 Tax=Acetobacter tropicalis NBRC 101654 TaxID=749388 RepID=F7VC23_9PROT|nr:hypothetical protein ATPR_0922 [Acetobacter tropicalis NBRC 101654]
MTQEQRQTEPHLWESHMPHLHCKHLLISARAEQHCTEPPRIAHVHTATRQRVLQRKMIWRSRNSALPIGKVRSRKAKAQFLQKVRL